MPVPQFLFRRSSGSAHVQGHGTFAGALQRKNPVLVRIGAKAGYGGGKPTSKSIEEYADLWAFTFFNLGVAL